MDEIVSNLKITVERLILQYKEYVQNETFIQNQLKANKPELVEVYQTDLERLSDEMTFKNHIVWLMYKHLAYLNSENEILYWSDLVEHCTPEDDICTQRFNFLHQWMLNKKNFDVLTIAKDSAMESVYYRADFLELLLDVEFLKSWQENEYRIVGNKVAKWRR